MKHSWGVYAVLLFMLLVSKSFPVQAQETESEISSVEICFFHNTACGTCDGTEEFRDTVSDQLSRYKEIYPYELKMYNVFKTEGREKLEVMFEEYHLEYDKLVFPLMMMNGDLLMGMQNITDHIFETYLASVDYSAIYFYRKDCQECIDLQPFMEEIPGQITVGEELVDFRLISLESRTDDNGDMIRALFEQYEVPDEDQMVPIVFLKDRYLAGKNVIEGEFLNMLEQGYGIGKNRGEMENGAMVSEFGEVLE